MKKNIILDVLTVVSLGAVVTTMILIFGYMVFPDVNWFSKKESHAKYTKYRAIVNNKMVICNVVEHSKLGYNMSNCENGNLYFNVTNIEMAVGE